jgi:hypothetical protein
MKIKQSILFISAMLIFSASFSQGVDNQVSKFPVIVAEAGIKSITVSSNIDLLLINAGPNDIKTTVPQESLDKVRINYFAGKLKIATKGFLPLDERIPVYVYVNGLESLTASGNAFVRTKDILDANNLKVNIEDEAKVAIRSRGKMKVNAPENYRRIEEERYHLVLSTE